MGHIGFYKRLRLNNDGMPLVLPKLITLEEVGMVMRVGSCMTWLGKYVAQGRIRHYTYPWVKNEKASHRNKWLFDRDEIFKLARETIPSSHLIGSDTVLPYCQPQTLDVNSSMKNKYVTLAEASNLLGVGKRTLTEWSKTGFLNTFRAKGSSTTWIPMQWITDYQTYTRKHPLKVRPDKVDKKQAAHMLGVSYITIGRYCKKGKLKFTKSLGGKVFIAVSEIEKAIHLRTQ